MKLRHLIVAVGVGALGLALVHAGPRGDNYDDRHRTVQDSDVMLEDGEQPGPKYCSKTAHAARKACDFEVKDDYWIAVGNCINVSDAEERAECEEEAEEDRSEAAEECGEQLDARLEVCELVGQERYNPDWDPENFVDPNEIGVTVEPNPYFPLVVGNEWIYEGDGERVTDTVMDKTKLIEGVTCRVVLDVVEEIEEEGEDEDGVVIEITDDWYAQDLDGNVWYCGESARDFETFEGDEPEEPELVEIDGSFKVGRDRAQAGILMLAHPEEGDAYRQEVALGEAEDLAEVVSTTGSESVPAAECDGDCVVTRDFTPLEPGVNEYKYYAYGVGLILELGADGERLELIEFNTP